MAAFPAHSLISVSKRVASKYAHIWLSTKGEIVQPWCARPSFSKTTFAATSDLLWSPCLAHNVIWMVSPTALHRSRIPIGAVKSLEEHGLPHWFPFGCCVPASIAQICFVSVISVRQVFAQRSHGRDHLSMFVISHKLIIVFLVHVPGFSCEWSNRLRLLVLSAMRFEIRSGTACSTCSSLTPVISPVDLSLTQLLIYISLGTQVSFKFLPRGKVREGEGSRESDWSQTTPRTGRTVHGTTATLLHRGHILPDFRQSFMNCCPFACLIFEACLRFCRLVSEARLQVASRPLSIFFPGLQFQTQRLPSSPSSSLNHP